MPSRFIRSASTPFCLIWEDMRHFTLPSALSVLLGLLFTAPYASASTSKGMSQIDRVIQQGSPWRPPDTPGPRSPLPVTPFPAVPATNPGNPVAELLITVRLLRDELKNGSIQPAGPARTALREKLTRLAAEPTLGAAKAALALQTILEQLNAPQEQRVRLRRLLLERNAQSMVARAQFATPDGPVNLAQVKYQFMVPDGMNVLKSLDQQPDLNPYRTPGVNAALLNEALGLLK